MLSIPHLIVIFVVALVIFGPEKIPELARNLGKVMAEFRRATGDLRNSFEGHLRDLEREADQHRISAAAARVAAPASSEPLAVTPATGTVPAGSPTDAAVAAGGAVAAPDSPGAPPREAAGPEPVLPDYSRVDPELQNSSVYDMAVQATIGAQPPPDPSTETLPEPAGEANPERANNGSARPA
jgi:sec-independent protein translocase protein TatB